ncbi:MAG: serine--tRNA ligase, partial [Candidatus Eremiobacteraeota bacterium]|nr:serine--tRNA ligase [Candidatus Eremiobacteraeota bacterium]
MLDRRLIREQPDRVRRSLARRQLPVSVVDDVLALDADWRAAVTALDAAKAERNQISAQFAQAKGQAPDVLAALRERSNELGEAIASHEQAAASLDQRLTELLGQVPNILADDVPDGADESANRLLRASGDP